MRLVLAEQRDLFSSVPAAPDPIASLPPFSDPGPLPAGAGKMAGKSSRKIASTRPYHSSYQAQPLAAPAPQSRDVTAGGPHRYYLQQIADQAARYELVDRLTGEVFYSCPSCRQRVEPYFFCALNALDFSIPAVRIGDREAEGLPPLKPRTLARVDYGLQKFGRRYLVVTTRYTTGMDFRVRDAGGDVMPTQPGAMSHGLMLPEGFLANTRQGQDFAPHRVKPTTGPLGTQTGDECMGVGLPSAILTTAGSRNTEPRFGTDSIPTLTGSDRLAVTVPPGAVVNNMENNQPRGLDGALHNICTGGNLGVALPPGAVVHHAYNTGERVSGFDGPLRALTTQLSDGLALPPAFISTQRQNNQGSALSGPFDAFCASGGHHALVVHGAALISLRDYRTVEQLARGLGAPLSTQVSVQQEALVTPGRFLMPYTRTGEPRGVDEEAATFDTRDRHALVEIEVEGKLRVEDSYFRMLQPVEIQAGMAFEREYIVLGNKRDRVKQLGNAVTPPVMEWIVGRCVDALERGRGPKRRVA